MLQKHRIFYFNTKIGGILMIKKNIVLILVILTFLNIVSFAQLIYPSFITVEEFTMEHRIAGIVEMKKTVSMLRMIKEGNNVHTEDRNQNYTVVYDTYPYSSNIEKYVYIYDGGETLAFYHFENELMSATNKDGFNLLRLEYTAKTADFQVLIDGKEVVSSNPIITIREKTYIPIVDSADQLGIKVNWDKEMQHKEFELAEKIAAPMKEAFSKLSKGMTIDETKDLIGEPSSNRDGYIDRPLYSFEGGEELNLWFDNDGKLSNAYNKDYVDLFSAEYIARTIDFPIFINDNELIVSNPIVAINNQVYVPLDNLAEQLGITVIFDEEKQQLEITTK